MREVTLLGQNVNAYDGDTARTARRRYPGPSWPYALAEIPGLDRIRYTTSHPNDMRRRPDRRPCASLDALMPYLHLPVQAGSDRILEADEPRKHGRQKYLEI